MSTKGPLRREGILGRKLGDEWMLYDPENGVVHILNATAESVWELCDGKHGHDEIAKHLRDDYQVPDGVELKNDVGDIIKGFADKGLLQSGEG